MSIFCILPSCIRAIHVRAGRGAQTQFLRRSSVVQSQEKTLFDSFFFFFSVQRCNPLVCSRRSPPRQITSCSPDKPCVPRACVSRTLVGRGGAKKSTPSPGSRIRHATRTNGPRRQERVSARGLLAVIEGVARLIRSLHARLPDTSHGRHLPQPAAHVTTGTSTSGGRLPKQLDGKTEIAAVHGATRKLQK